MKIATIAAVTVASALSAPAAAVGATYSVTDFGSFTEVAYSAESGTAHAIDVNGSPDRLTVTDPTDTITTANEGGCTKSNDERTLVCDPATPLRLTVEGGDLGDSITSTATGFTVDIAAAFGPGVHLRGGPGADTITGGPSDELLQGDAGADTIRGGAGDDVIAALGDTDLDQLSGGEGDDIFQTDGSGDAFEGGPNDDSIVNLNTSLAQDGQGNQLGMTIRLNGATTTTGNGYPTQNLSLTNVERAYGGAGADTFTGSAAGETLIGLGGSDTLDGGGGLDFIYGDTSLDPISGQLSAGGPGLPAVAPDDDNVLTSRDGVLDVVDCGPAGGTLTADDIDLLSGCPAVGSGTTLVPVPKPAPVEVRVPVNVPTRVNVPTPVFDRTRARISAFKAARSVKGKALRKNGRYSVEFTTNEAASGAVTLLAKAGKVAGIAAAGDLQLATKSVKTTAGAKRTVTLTVPKKLRRLLKKGRRFTAVVTLVDGGGNTTIKRQAVKIG